MEIYQENGLYGLRNDCGEVLIAPQYREFYPFSCGLACVQNIKYQYSYINQENQVIIPFGNYMWLDYMFTCGYANIGSVYRALSGCQLPWSQSYR